MGVDGKKFSDVLKIIFSKYEFAIKIIAFVIFVMIITSLIDPVKEILILGMN